jgi:hypothetical protein
MELSMMNNQRRQSLFHRSAHFQPQKSKQEGLEVRPLPSPAPAGFRLSRQPALAG